MRLLVSQVATGRLWHASFRDLPEHLRPGDLLVLNTSATLPAALDARRALGGAVRPHLSGPQPGDLWPGLLWTVELRRPEETATTPLPDARAGETLALPEGGSAPLPAPAHPGVGDSGPGSAVRLWLARLTLSAPLLDFLARHGQPIRYAYVPEPWPLATCQTVYATEPGSAEMPSAGRAFTPELLTRLMAAEVGLAPLLLHAGVASLGAHEPPSAECYRVPEGTARRVNAGRAAAG